jgi:hypothetical protein
MCRVLNYTFNLWIFIDILFILKNPLASHKRRHKLFFWAMMLSSVVYIVYSNLNHSGIYVEDHEITAYYLYLISNNKVLLKDALVFHDLKWKLFNVRFIPMTVLGVLQGITGLLAICILI